MIVRKFFQQLKERLKMGFDYCTFIQMFHKHNKNFKYSIIHEFMFNRYSFFQSVFNI